MEKVTSKKNIEADNSAKIIHQYIQHILENGEEPVSVYKFARELKIKEEDFYNHFTSFKAVKSAVWTKIFDDTVKVLEAQEVFKEYSAREKFLGFFFTWVEELKKYRSYLLVVYGKSSLPRSPFPGELKDFKIQFKDFISKIILEGKETEEIANRPYLSDKYDEALWMQVLFIFQFWLKDKSAGFEKTDAAIEKSVNLAFDLMGKSAVDTFVDFAKFLYQSR